MSARIQLYDTPIAGVQVLVRKPTGDARGFLERLYCEAELASALGSRRIQQVNRTLTASRGTVRGMHFQHPPAAEVKIVSCLRGRVFDVAVDLREGSSTFLHWHGEILGGDEHRSLIIPEGCAHGFQTLTDDCEMLYLHTASYTPASEDGVHPNDPRLAIEWPEPISTLSARDGSHPLLPPEFNGISL